MIKTIVFLTKVLVATITSLLFASCMVSGKRGDGNMRTETRNITGEFTKIDVSNGIHVTIEPEAATAVTVEADNNIMPLIATYVENGTLYINSKESYNTSDPVWVRVKMPKVDGLRGNGGTIIDSKRKIIADMLTLDAESAAVIDIETESDDLRATSASGSSIKLKGKALKLSTDASSGSTIDAENLMANDITSESSSGGASNVSPIVSLNAKASSGGVVHYNREPKLKTVSESSGGSVANTN